MKFTIKLCRTLTHYAEFETEAPTMMIAEELADEVVERLDYPSLLPPSEHMKKIDKICGKLEGEWELDNEEFEWDQVDAQEGELRR